MMIAPQIKGGLTVEEIIAQDENRVEERRKIMGTEKETTLETILRLAKLTVKYVKEKGKF